jgi:hypothetical protein
MNFVLHTGVMWRVVNSAEVATISLESNGDASLVCVDVTMKDGTSFKSNWFRSRAKAEAMQVRIAEMCGRLIEGGINSRLREDQ